MASTIQFQQTSVNNDSPPGIVAMCSGASVHANCVGKKAEVGGSSGVTSFITVPKNADALFITHQLPINNEYFLPNTLGLYPCVYRLNLVSGASADLYWRGLWFCLVDQHGASRGTIAGVVSPILNQRMNRNKVYTQSTNMIYTQAQYTHYYDDYFYVCIRITNTNIISNQIIGITFDQLIDIELETEAPPIISEFTHRDTLVDEKYDVVGYEG